MRGTNDVTRKAFVTLAPADPDVTSGRYSGSSVAHVKGPLSRVVRQTHLEVDRVLVLRQGGEDFRTKGYVTLPDGWIERPAQTCDRVAAVLDVREAMRSKVPGKRSATRRR